MNADLDMGMDMDMDMPPNATYAFVEAFVDELARAGLAHVCICPGSRSTPLALVFTSQPRIRVWMHLDERSAAFFALGLAKATGEATAILCTSGTAAANFMPAVVEAKQARVPLIVLTADRPPEVRDFGAPQTIDQIRFYGAQVRWSVEMPLPEATEPLLRFARAMAARAMDVAMSAPGPVHLNFPFREPLVPAQESLPAASHVARRGRAENVAYAFTYAMPGPTADAVEDTVRTLAHLPKGLIVCGPLERAEHMTPPLAALAYTLGYPVLADPLSGLRCGPHDRELVIDAYDAFLRDERFAAGVAPQAIVRFGAMPTAKPLLQYLQRHTDIHHLLIETDSWRDPGLLATEVIHTDPELFCRQVAKRSLNKPDEAWLTLWREANRRTRAALAEALVASDELFEGRAMAELATLLPEGATLFAGNSMPVRDVDTFFPGSGLAVQIMGNRGASGIDGVVSTALGVAARGDGPVVLAIGDVSFYHDMNGLLAAKQHALDLTVVLLNNDGGGIFSFLPQADLPADAHGDPFETLFGTPHGLDFSPVAALYSATYTCVRSWAEYRGAVAHGIEMGGLHIVEVPSERARNVALHRRLWPIVSAAIADLVP